MSKLTDFIENEMVTVAGYREYEGIEELETERLVFLMSLVKEELKQKTFEDKMFINY